MVFHEQFAARNWRDVDSYEGIYQVSNLSRVKSFYGRRTRILKHHIDIDGYTVVSLSRNAKDKVFGVHTLVARAFIENPENKPQVHHQDNNKLHSYIWNLEWVTVSENAQYAILSGSRKRGAESFCASLTAEQVKEILQIYVKGSKDFGCRGLSKKYNVHHTTIHNIISGKTYNEITKRQ